MEVTYGGIIQKAEPHSASGSRNNKERMPHSKKGN
jgi:hypothetical protein